MGTKNNKGKAIRRSLKKRKRSEDSEEDSNYEVDPEAIKVEEKFIKMQFHSNETSMQSSQKNSKLNGTRNGSSSLRNNRRVEKLKEKR